MQTPAAEIADLFDEHFDAVYAYIAWRLAPDQQAAGELSREVFASAWEGMGALRQAESTRSWLLAIARNKVADHYRAIGGDNGRLIDGVSTGDLIDAAAEPEDRNRRERALLVSMTMRRLGDDQAELLEDKYIRGLSVRAIAQRRDATEKAVESALSRAREAFRRTYAQVQQSEESPR